MNIKLGILVLGLLLPLGQTQALVLDSWNDADLNASDDLINVEFGTTGDGDDWFSLQWQAGADNELTALGIDTVFYNCDGCSGVFEVWENGIDTGSDVTSDWKLNFGGGNSGGGFGTFSSLKNLDSGGTSGIDPDMLYFVFNGAVDFITNNNDAMFAVHVRYEQDCSGWVSDGNTTESGSGGCGGSVPEPGPLTLAGLGLLTIGVVRRFRRVL
jgi:hypothetical protein